MKWVKDILNKYVCNLHACSIIEHAFVWSIFTCSFNALNGYKISMFSELSYFKKHLSVTAFCRCSWQPIETINCYYSEYFKGNQLKQIIFSLYINFSIYFKSIKTTRLMYYLNESSVGMLLDNENSR